MQQIHRANSAYTLLPGIVNRVRVCHISSIFLYFHWIFDNRHYFYARRTFISFFKSSPSARLYLEVLKTIPRLNLKTVCIDSLLCYISFCFLHGSALFSYFCICQLYFMHFSHVVLHRMVFASILTTSRYII